MQLAAIAKKLAGGTLYFLTITKDFKYFAASASLYNRVWWLSST